MKKTLKIMLAAVLSIAMLMTFAAAAEDTLTNAGTADLISATAPESDTIDAHHDEHALGVFTDAPAFDSWKYQGLNCAVNNGTMTGHENKIRPDDSLTRAEMVTMMVRVLGAHATKAEIEHYVDVVAGQWYYEALQSGVAVKIINGSGNKMMPNDPITREQIFTILARTFLFSAKTDAAEDFVDSDKVSSWALNATNALIDAEVVLGDNTKTLRPKDNATRAEFATMLDRIACLFVNVNTDYSGKKVSGSLIVNDATADLSGATIEGDLIITDAVGAENIDLSDVTVTGRIVIRGGDVNLNEGTTAAEVVVGNPTSASKVTAAEGVTVDKITVAENANDVEIDVPAKEVVIDSSANEVTISKDAEEVTVNGSENTVNVPEGTKIDNVTVNGESSKVTGSGDVSNATVNGYDSTVETPNTSVTDNSPATKPGTTPDTGDDKTDDGKDDSSSSKPNSDPNASTNSGSLPGSSNKPSTALEIYEDGTYVSYGFEDAKHPATVNGNEITFDLRDMTATEETVLNALYVSANKDVALALDTFNEVTDYTTNEEINLVDLLASIVASTNEQVAPAVGIITGAADYTLGQFADTVETVCILCTDDESEDAWAREIFEARGITAEWVDGDIDSGYASATFSATIGGESYKVTVIVPTFFD